MAPTQAEALLQWMEENELPGAPDPRYVLARTVCWTRSKHLAPAQGRDRPARGRILREHFTDPCAAGPQMAARAAGAPLPAETVAASCAVLASDLLRAIDRGR